MPKWILYALIGAFILAGTFVYLYQRNSVKSQEIALYEQNWKAIHDSVKYYKLKNGELMAEKAGYILTLEGLEQELGISKAEIKDLQKKLGSKVSSITKVETVTKVDTLLLETEVIKNDTMIIGNFNHFDEWLAMNGQFRWTPSETTTTLHNLTMNTPLKVGRTENNTFFVTWSLPRAFLRRSSMKRTGGCTMRPSTGRIGLS